MSQKAMVWALKQKPGCPMSKWLLTYLAMRSDEDSEAWPSVSTISKETEISRRTIQRLLRKLSDLGYLRVEERRRFNQSFTSNRITLAVPSDTPIKVCHGDAGASVMVTQGGCHGDAPRQSILQTEIDQREYAKKRAKAFLEVPTGSRSLWGGAL